MGLRQAKQTYVSVVRAYLARGLLDEEEASQFESMVRRCRSQAEMAQVTEVLRNWEEGFRKGTDAAALIMRDDDPLGLDEVEERLLKKGVVTPSGFPQDSSR